MLDKEHKNIDAVSMFLLPIIPMLSLQWLQCNWASMCTFKNH